MKHFASYLDLFEVQFNDISFVYIFSVKKTIWTVHSRTKWQVCIFLYYILYAVCYTYRLRGSYIYYIFIYIYFFFRGIKLIERNEEVCVFYEKLNVQGRLPAACILFVKTCVIQIARKFAWPLTVLCKTI